MTAEGLIHSDGFLYVPGFLDQAAQGRLVRYLDTVPVVEPGTVDVTRQFAFCAPSADGTVVRERREAAAGWPVWTGSEPEFGVQLPSILAQLADQAGGCLASLKHPEAAGPSLAFSSVYVDRYQLGGSFVPHTDRACYGPVVGGVSVGPGSCRMTFRSGGEVQLAQSLEPGGLYAFFGSLRSEPCTHEIDLVTGVRYGISLRTPAAALMEVDR